MYRKTFSVIQKNKVGDTWIEGTKKKVDAVGFSKGYVPQIWGSQEFPIMSGLTRERLVRIEKSFRPKDLSKGGAWLSNKDYSDNPNFEMYFEYIFESEELYYDLMDLISEVPTYDKVSIIFDENDRMQFFIY